VPKIPWPQENNIFKKGEGGTMFCRERTHVSRESVEELQVAEKTRQELEKKPKDAPVAEEKKGKDPYYPKGPCLLQVY
jgi:hypothetical protein